MFIMFSSMYLMPIMGDGHAGRWSCRTSAYYFNLPHAMPRGDEICTSRYSNVDYSTIHLGFGGTTCLNVCSVRKRMVGAVADVTPIHEGSVKLRHAVQDEVAQCAGN